MRKSENHIYFIILLALLSSVAPMGIDTYIPSIPDIANSFDVNIEKVELSLSIFLIGFSIGQIFGGPLSDYYGRKKSSIVGLLGFTLFSFIIIFATNIYELWIYRFFEAFFGGIVIVNATAAVRDKFKGVEAAKVFSLLGVVRGVAPLIAPAIGAFIIHFFHWSAVFIFLTIYSLFTTFLIYNGLEESYVKSKQTILESFKMVLINKEALKAMLILGLSFSGFFILLSKSSFIYIDYFKISSDYFPFYFGVNFIVLMILTKFNVYLLKSYKVIALVKIALFIQLLVGVLMVILYKDISLVQTAFIMATYMGVMALVFGNALSLALEYFPKNAGVASSVAGVLQFGLGAIISSIVLSFHIETFLPIGLSISLISLIAYLIVRTYK